MAQRRPRGRLPPLLRHHPARRRPRRGPCRLRRDPCALVRLGARGRGDRAPHRSHRRTARSRGLPASPACLRPRLDGGREDPRAGRNPERRLARGWHDRLRLSQRRQRLVRRARGLATAGRRVRPRDGRDNGVRRHRVRPQEVRAGAHVRWRNRGARSDAVRIAAPCRERRHAGFGAGVVAHASGPRCGAA